MSKEVRLSVYLPIYHLSIHLSIHPSLKLCGYVNIHKSIRRANYLPFGCLGFLYNHFSISYLCVCVFLGWGARRAPCRTLVPGTGIEPMPHAVEVQSLNHWTTGEVPHLCF